MVLLSVWIPRRLGFLESGVVHRRQHGVGVGVLGILGKRLLQGEDDLFELVHPIPA